MNNRCDFNQINNLTKKYESVSSINGNIKDAYHDIGKIINFIKCANQELKDVSSQIKIMRKRATVIKNLIYKEKNSHTINNKPNTNNLSNEECDDYYELDYKMESYDLGYADYKVEESRNHLIQVNKFIDCMTKNKVNKSGKELTEIDNQINKMRDIKIKIEKKINAKSQFGGNHRYTNKYIKYK